MLRVHRKKRAMRWDTERSTISPRYWPAGQPSIRSGGIEMHVLLVTRRLPSSIEALAAREFEARLTPSDIVIADLVAKAEGADAMLCCPGDVLDAKTIADLPASVKVVGT